MPELPDITIYLESLHDRIHGSVLRDIRLASPFLLRTVEPSWKECREKTVRGFRRMGKRIVFELDDDLFVVLHLMVAGRLQWKKAGSKVPGRVGLAAFDFDGGALILTEASKKKRASLHIHRGETGLEMHERGGLEVLEATRDAFAERLVARNHTLKRAMTDARILSGVGNAYSDEILFEAKLSPMKLTSRLDDEELTRLYEATLAVLHRFTDAMRRELDGAWPKKVTAFRSDMAVHGRYKEPCVRCEAPIQRIRYASNETNYCARCQNAGRLLADRSLSRLLKKDWPKTLEELEG